MILIFIVALFLSLYNTISFEIFLFTISPFYQLILYRCAFFKFLKKMKRIPKDVAFNFKTGLFFDRVFTLLYLMVAIMLPIVVIVQFK